ncbi:MAG: ArsR family transcriptional regulator [Chloroflexi bacterium]|nr:MAG: ArsR family transcriptional regulator [Chloroflexota bacterium]
MKTVQQADADTFTAVAHPVRRQLLDLLATGDQSVSQLAARFTVTRPAISQHLKVLLDAGLVSEQRQGRERIYRLHPQPLQELDSWLEPYRRLWENRFDRLDTYLQQWQDKEKHHDHIE